MEMELYSDMISGDEDHFQVAPDNDDSAFDGERCGICMDMVIDRGVLDCCQHWFCFGCIDNWSTITNLCPLCQNEFQLITCVPVYDTTGSNKVEEESFSRDDDWSLEEKNNTLSFPSYYIDENAIVCLDGNGCKIRNGVAVIEDDADFDTSIACDSCDTWYHAFCVGFDTEDTSESTWLCPKCDIGQPSQTADVNPGNELGNYLETGASNTYTDTAFTGKISVSIADAGETAVVISMVEENHVKEEPSENLLSNFEVDRDQGTLTFASNSDGSRPEGQTSSNTATGVQIQHSFEAKGSNLVLSRDPSDSLPSSLSVFRTAETGNPEKTLSQKNDPEELTEGDSTICLAPALEVNVETLGSIVSDQADVALVEDKQSDSLLSVNNFITPADVAAVGIAGSRRKYQHISDDGLLDIDNNEVKADSLTNSPAKRPRAKESILMIMTEDHVKESGPDHSQKPFNPQPVSKDDKARHSAEKPEPSDIMSIVMGRDHRSRKRLVSSDPVTNSSEGVNASGLRVKKIMRRPHQDDESAVLVQKLRQQIREAVRNKSVKDAGKELFDSKLLAAFRAAVVGPTDKDMKSSPSVIQTKKSTLQKGKVRESLTRKIYGTSNGKRKRAWDREYEVEFWKRRCMRSSKPEKIETLKSVLDLLRKKPGGVEAEHHGQLQETNPILSRLFLADTSVFPRSDDTKSIPALKDADNLVHNSEPVTSTVKSLKQNSHNHTNNKGGLNRVQTSKGLPTTSSTVVPPNRALKGPSGSLSGTSSKVDRQKEKVAKSDDIRSDKRKWAQEVLARKTAAVGQKGSHEQQEDTVLLKGNYPLLTQLPVDMRPTLSVTHRNKIPMSVRQTQLYRLTELFLKKACVQVICRTAESELAVADAINIEKEIADRSNSKLVYVNLCSQEIMRRSHNASSGRTPEVSTSSPQSTVSVDVSEEATNEPSSDPVVEEALRNAGLLSDSPPESPLNNLNALHEDVQPVNAEDEGPANIFEMDACSELDIYGDFEYDIEDEDYFGTDATNISKPQSEGESRVKVVLSTVTLDRSNDALDSAACARKQIDGSSCLLKGQTDANLQGPTIKCGVDKASHPPQQLKDEEEQEPSLAECDELYGPDKDPLMVKFPEIACRKPEPVDTEVISTAKGSGERNGSYQEDCRIEIENSPAAPLSLAAVVAHDSSGKEIATHQGIEGGEVNEKRVVNATNGDKQSDESINVSKKVEAYIKEHIRPLCKSGVITAEQYRWAVAKTTEKVMKYHSKDKNANFLIREGEKVKKLAEQYIETAPQK